MRRLLLLTLALTLAACSPAAQPQPEQPAPAPTRPSSPVPEQAPRLTVTPHQLITALPDRVHDDDAVALRPVSAGVTIRIRLADGRYSPGWGGEQGQALPPQGTGIGPLTPGTAFEVLDGATWVGFARYQ